MYTSNIFYQIDGLSICIMTGIIIIGSEGRHVVVWHCSSDDECQPHCPGPIFHCINTLCVCHN